MTKGGECEERVEVGNRKSCTFDLMLEGDHLRGGRGSQQRSKVVYMARMYGIYRAYHVIRYPSRDITPSLKSLIDADRENKGGGGRKKEIKRKVSQLKARTEKDRSRIARKD